MGSSLFKLRKPSVQCYGSDFIVILYYGRSCAAPKFVSTLVAYFKL